MPCVTTDRFCSLRFDYMYFCAARKLNLNEEVLNEQNPGAASQKASAIYELKSGAAANGGCILTRSAIVANNPSGSLNNPTVPAGDAYSIVSFVGTAAASGAVTVAEFTMKHCQDLDCKTLDAQASSIHVARDSK